FNVKESTSCASDIFLTPIDSLKSTTAAVSNPNPNPLPPPLSLWQAADQMACPYSRPRSNISSSQACTSES
ncbi:hypothetical protein ARMGADRAFT_1015734, partial [Armillaria gallica]